MTNKEIYEVKSMLNNIMSRMGVACTYEWVYDELRKVASLMCSWADRCEHGVIEGGWCPECNAEYKRAALIDGESN